MKKFWLFIGKAILVMAVCVLPACNGDDDDNAAPTYEYFAAESPGPYAVGYATADLENGPRERTLKLDIWYPAETQDTDETVAYYNIVPGDAVEDAPVDRAAAPFPLVVFSHGNQGISFQNSVNCEYLATHGYLVVAPNHTANSLLDFDETLVEAMMEIRPQDISATIDWVLDSEYRDLIDSDRIGLMGHSYGAYTSLAVAGAVVDKAAFNTYCNSVTDQSDWGCNFFGEFDESDPVESTKDERVKAIVPISPGFYRCWGDELLAAIDVPTLIVAGTEDAITPYETEAVPIFEGLLPEKGLLTFTGANHYTFTIMCDIVGGGEQCDAGMETSEVNPALNTYLAAFWGLNLKGVEDYRQYFSGDLAPQYPGVSLDWQP